MQRQRYARSLSSLLYAYPHQASHHGSHALPSFFLSNSDDKPGSMSSEQCKSLQTTRTFSGGGFDAFKTLFDEFLSPSRFVTSSIIILSLTTYALDAILGMGLDSSFSQINYFVLQGQVYRIITAAFLHHGFIHLLGNMLSLHFIGPDVERIVGRSLFLFLFLASAAGGGVAHLILGSSYSSLVGASAGVMGLLAGLVTLKLMNPNFHPFTPNDSQWLVQLVVINVAIAAMSGGGISHIGHLGGAIGGGLAMYLFGPRYRYGRRGEGIINEPIIPLFKYRR